ncbi:hypothetical protein FOF68_06665 [Lactobacillus jensenii]|uniref:hypothetical protein n=1 Tax=Lactobacillus jensenii TaxID=109790 RepID=UPI001194DF5F|nr:hypothetical protein [Lactobacillus jensenii]MDK7324341.1 hypothetical protein [Lactobacillus jensenii]TVV07118.1 hypothetical protein FOF68_06665 [Lactobacillus jensenii]
MKKINLFISIVAVIIVAAGGFLFYSNKSQSTNTSISASSPYTQAMASGKENVKNEKYDAAASDFNKAYDLKHTAKAKAYANQAENMSDAITYGKRAKYTASLNSINKVINEENGYDVLISKAQTLKKVIKTAYNNYKTTIQPLLEAAQEAERKQNFQLAINNYEQVLELPYINDRYYQAIKSNTEDKLNKDKALLKKQSSSSSSSSSMQSSSSSSSNSNSKMNGEFSGNRTVDGKNVSSATQSEIRNRLNSLGYNASPWSPQNIINLYRYAFAQGHKTPDSITKSDVENYLKPSN